MNADSIREILGREPFEPFRLRLSSGDTVEVRHPENVALGKNRVIVVEFGEDGEEHVHHLSYLHIAQAEFWQPASV